MTFFNRPVPVPENSDYSGFVILTSGHDETVWWLAFAFGFPVALEVLAIQSLLLLKLPSLLFSHHQEKQDQKSKAGYHLINHPTPTTTTVITSSYHLKEFVGDVALAAIVGSSKFALDFLYMPSHTHYYSIGWTQSIISSGVLATTGLCVSLGKLYVNNSAADNGSRSTAAKAGQLIIKMLQALIVGGITVGVEDLFRYLLLDNARGEEQDQLATAQVAGALAGGITWSVLNRVVTPNTTNQAIQWAARTRVGSSLLAFFTPRRLPSDHGNISINSNPQHAPQP